MPILPKSGKRVIWRDMAVFGGGSGVNAAISSQFHIGHTYAFHHTKEEPWSSFI